jgi:hypothetical protein
MSNPYPISSTHFSSKAWLLIQNEKIVSANSHEHSPLSAIKQKVYVPRTTDSLATVPETITYCRRFIYVSSE